MEKQHERIFQMSRFIFREFLGTISGEEKRLLEAWREENPENEILYRRLKDRCRLRARMQRMEEINILPPLEDMYRRIAAEKRVKRQVKIQRLTAIAAMLVIVIGCLCLFRKDPGAGKPVETMISAGVPRAILRLDNGAMIDLDTLTSSLKQGEVVLAKTNQRKLAYDAGETTPTGGNGKLVYNEIEIPRGGEFDIVLADGTVVWLNADSKFRFPVTFSGKERRVYLEGEAYFQVKKNPGLPFRVETRNQVVEVLGTEFNVSGYREDENVYTTLVTGKVKVATADRDMTLSPGEQCVWDTDNNRMMKQQVDVEKIVSWKKGKFILEEQTLEQIMQKFIRWYDVAVFYQNPELKHKVFRGSVPRYTELQQVLDILSKTGEVHFNIQNRTVVVYE